MEDWMRVRIVLLLVALGLGCNSREDVFGPTPDKVVVRVRADEIDPEDAAVAVGGVVTWRFESSTPHNLIFEVKANAPEDEEPMHSGNETVDRTFDAKGDFRYFCRDHPDLKGVIRVL
jgi:plastocyanin